MVTDGGEGEGGEKRMWLLNETVLFFNNSDDYTNLHL